MGAKAFAFKGVAMQHRDIGEIDGPIVLFGGPYSNLQALNAMLDAIGSRRAICTGDVVAYGADAFGCVEELRASGIPVVAGNCEQQIASGAQDCGCGFEDGSACDLASRGWFAHATAHITSEQRAWMDGLPDLLFFAMLAADMPFCMGRSAPTTCFCGRALTPRSCAGNWPRCRWFTEKWTL